MRDLPSPRRGGADVADHVPRRPPLGGGDSRQGEDARHAAVACRSAARHLPERSQPERARDRHDRPVGRRGRARRRSRRHAAAAEVCRRLADRHAGRGVPDGGGVSGSAHRHDRLPVLRGADQLHRRSVDAGGRSARRRSRARASHHRLRAGAAAQHAADRHDGAADCLPGTGGGSAGEAGGPGRSTRGSGTRRGRPGRRQHAGELGGRRGRADSSARHGEAHTRGLDADLPGALHDKRNAGTRPVARRIDFRQGAAAARGPHRDHRERIICHPARGARSPGGSGSDVRRGRQGLVDASAHAPARQGHDLHGDLPGRPQPDHPARAEVRLRLADRLLAGRAARIAQGVEASRDGPLRQLDGESQQSGRGRNRALGRPDLGRDDDRVHHLHRRQPGGGGEGRCR